MFTLLLRRKYVWSAFLLSHLRSTSWDIRHFQFGGRHIGFLPHRLHSVRIAIIEFLILENIVYSRWNINFISSTSRYMRYFRFGCRHIWISVIITLSLCEQVVRRKFTESSGCARTWPSTGRKRFPPIYTTATTGELRRSLWSLHRVITYVRQTSVAP